jgi:hypothetical protein
VDGAIRRYEIPMQVLSAANTRPPKRNVQGGMYWICGLAEDACAFYNGPSTDLRQPFVLATTEAPSNKAIFIDVPMD